MEIRVLHYFLTIAREENISRAAEVLHITQPTLSRQIAQLEESLGVTLFYRGARKITLTEEGMLLRRRAEEILSLVEKTEEELRTQDDLIDGRIVIGSGELAAMQLLPDIIRTFHANYPRVQFDLLTANADVIKDQIEKGLADIGVLLEPIDMTKFDFIRLPTPERWVVLMRPDDPLAEKAAISPEDLAGRSVIMPRRPNLQSELKNWFGEAFDAVRVDFTSNLSTNGAIMVQAGLGYSLVIEGSVPLWDTERIIHRPLSPSLTASSVIAWKKEQPLNLATSKFIEQLLCFLSRERHEI